MTDFKFEFELNPISRASAALDNEGERISDELEHSRRSFCAQLWRVMAAGALIIGILFLVAAMGDFPPHISPGWAMVSALLMSAGISAARARGSVSRLIRFECGIIRARRELADWKAVRHELNSTANGLSKDRLGFKSD